MKKHLMPFFLFVMVAGCSYLPAVGPDYQTIKLDLPEAYREGTLQQAVSSTHPYWERLGDPTLILLEHKAMAQSLTLQQAWQRVKQARASAGMAVSSLGPHVQAQGGYTGERMGAQANLINGTTQTLDIFSAGIGAQWELDILGGNRRGLESARAHASAQQAQADGIRSTVLAEVARQYVAYRALQQQAALVEREVSATATLSALANHQARVGLINGNALAQAQARHAAIAMQLPPLQAAVSATQYGLESLLGQKPGSLSKLLNPIMPLPAVPASTSLVLPSELVLLRPDLRAREREAAAATADIGVAMADLFPRFSLTGYYGVQGPQPGGLNQSSALVWNGGPEFRWTLFAMGQVWQNIKLQKARQKEAVLAYQQAALDALADVESNLAQFRAASESLQKADVLAQNTAKQTALAEAQHATGRINGLALQEVTLAGLEGSRAHLQAHQQALTRYINLHQALGL